jgi:acyl-homoserine lactone acylase PvdQ
MVILATLAVWVGAPTAGARDYATTARNVIPSGQYGSVPVPPDAGRQADLYDGLTPLFNRVGPGDVLRYFKSEALGTDGQGPLRTEPIPRPGATVVRDGYNVPHITGRTDDDVTWAAGWVMAEDRALLLQQARYPARVAAVDAPGLSALPLISSLRSFTPSAQTEAELAKQTGALMAQGAKGRQVLHDIDVFIAGINAYLSSTGSSAAPWTRNDVYALNALKGQFVGQGGGGEVRSSLFLSGLRRRLGARRGESVWNDLRQRQDPETPVTVDGRFPYAPLPAKRRGNVVLDAGSFRPSTAGIARAAALGTPPPHASNILMATRGRSTSRRPLMVGGPQIGYFYPGLTLEMDLKGPGWQTRGATSAPFPGYMLIGRGEDFAWSLTSAGLDIIDHYVETLCGGSKKKYVYRGRCRDMTFFDAGALGAGSDEPAREVTFNRTVHGPVVGYATVNGREVAIARKRSSYGRDTVDQLLYRDLTRGKVRSVRSFFKAASQTPQTFNSFYIDHKNVAMYTSGRVPIRPRSIDSGLPVDGRGRYEWRGYLSSRRHPQGINPKNGLINNWNNKPARGVPAADDQFGYGPIGRVDLLNRGTARRKRHTLASLVGVMNAAATQDVRTITFVPLLARVLRGGSAPSARARQMLGLLQSWRRSGGSRLDRDLDGKIDAPGAAILDAAWPKLADAAMVPVLGKQLADELDTSLFARFDQPPAGQFDGWHMYMDKDLRTLLGLRVSGKLANRYCGRGSLRRCRQVLWAALDAAGAELAQAQGPNPAAWRKDAIAERIKFVPGVFTKTMRYSNRPSGIQQVISFRGHR